MYIIYLHFLIFYIFTRINFIIIIYIIIHKNMYSCENQMLFNQIFNWMTDW